MHRNIRDALTTACILLAACIHTAQASPPTLYSGGSILTMEGDAPAYVEALLVRDGRIAFAGSKAEAEILAGSARRVDLAGKTLLPGFIDGHGHIFQAGFQRAAVNLYPDPDGPGNDIPSLVSAIKAWHARADSPLMSTGWIVGFGYDDSRLAEKRHPTATELDAVSKDMPVLIMHQSGHLGVANHKALELMGYNANSPDPAGGVIRREADGRSPNGVLEESAFFLGAYRSIGVLDDATNAKVAIAGIEAYASAGFTTAQEGRSNGSTAEAWRALATAGQVPIDVAVYPDIQTDAEYLAREGTSTTYDHHVRIAGAKLSLDGSPQGKTAWLTRPYLVPPHGQQASYAGYPAISDPAERARLVELAFRNHWQLLVHCNGDAAAQAMIDAVAQAEVVYGIGDRRPVMIHAQTVRRDQLERMRELGIIPSFFTLHAFYWGDWHREETLGRERSEQISPTATALRLGMRFSTHNDAPVTPPNALAIVDATVNRTSRSGELMGGNERVSPYIALKSVTEWAAWQYFEEQAKGTLTKGKLADFVVLDGNPLQVEPARIRDIRVLETIKEGETVFRAP